MPPRLSAAGARTPSFRLRLAHLGFIDAAPLLVAQHHGFFEQEGVDVQLTCELGVAALAAKLGEQLLDGACLPAHYHVLLSCGAGGVRVPMDGVLVCSYQDLAIVLAAGQPPLRGAAAHERTALKLGVLTPGSPARCLVQRWLQLDFAAARLEPVFVPLAASQLLHFLGEGAIDGFCGIEPLPALAVACGRGAVVAQSDRLHPGHPGGAVALRREVAETRPGLRDALRQALLRARRYCADPAHADEIWKLVLAHAPAVESRESPGTFTPPPAELPPAHRPAVRFDGPVEAAGLDESGARFVELACQTAGAETLRTADVAAEIARVYRWTESAPPGPPR